MGIQYLNDRKGNIQSVLLPFKEWEKILFKHRKYDQEKKLTDDLTEAFDQVEILRKSKGKKQTLSDFLNEL